MTTTKRKTPAKSKKPAKKRAAPKARVAPKASVAPKTRVAPKTKSAATASRAVALKSAKVRASVSGPRIETPSASKHMPPATFAMNAKLADIARTNMNAGLELASDLAKAKSPMEAMRLGLAYWYDNIGVFQSQAQELRALSANLVTTANEPIRESIRRT